MTARNRKLTLAEKLIWKGELEQFVKNNYFDFRPLNLSAELLDSCGKPPYHWTLFSEDEQKVIATVDKDKFLYKDLPYGKYTLHVSDEFSKNTESFTGKLIKMRNNI